MNRIPRVDAPIPSWTAARWLVLLITVSLIVSFSITPEKALDALWYILIPILPATFLINAEMWRNVCPLATLNTLGGVAIGKRRIERTRVNGVGLLGIALLAIMVPARRFLFNTDATILGLTITTFCALAIVGGLLFDVKAGFCNSLCPVLPVERLYGQRPLATVPNVRCIPCSACTGTGCFDLAPEQSAVQVLGEASATRRWMITGYGAFALSFPGAVIAYYRLADVPLSEAPTVYATVAFWATGSWLVLAGLFGALRIHATRALLVCGALAVGIYYWYVPLGIANEFGLPSAFTWGLRVVTLGLVAFWLLNGLEAPMNGAPARPRA